MAIRAQNGRVLTRGGAISCECCDQPISFNVAIGPEPSVCDCNTVVCFDPANPDAPVASPTYDRGFGTFANPYFPYANFVGLTYLQIPWAATTTPGPGWRNVVSGPSVMRLQGQVGGDLRIVVNRTVTATDPTFPDFDEIIDEAESPCGLCAVPRNGAHPINYTFPLKPNVILYFDVRTYFQCQGWLRATLTRVGPYTPP